MFAPQFAASVLLVLTIVAGCVQESDSQSQPHPGILWVRSAAEFEALSLQAYRAAGDFLDGAIDDTNWSALPQQTSAADLPTAIILDVDETLVSNVEFQVTLEAPFRNSKLDNWNTANKAKPMPGAAEFAELARAAGVKLFFVTNRPCKSKPGLDDPCPQEAVTIQDLVEAGIPADADHVMLANERPEWRREKSSRRNFIATTHRVIMLVGDDLGDFLPCTRKKPYTPCTAGASIASRQALTYEHESYWGAGWFVLPNPMHGSWTSVE
jgi:acid phosphatase